MMRALCHIRTSWPSPGEGDRTPREGDGMLRLLRAFVLAGWLFSPVLAGCAKRVPLQAPVAFFPSGVYVRVNSAFIDGDRVYVELRMMNGAKVPIYVNLDGMGLRLPDGRVLRRAAMAGRDRYGPTSERTAQSYHSIRRGFARTWSLEFVAPGGAQALAPVTLIVGGVSFGTDPTPVVVGDLLLTRTDMPPGARSPVLMPRPGPIPSPWGSE
jgi:hypothetical protein